MGRTLVLQIKVKSKRGNEMTARKVMEIMEEYTELFKRMGISPKPLKDYNNYTNEVKDNLSHIHWMVQQIPKILADHKLDKAYRWLGFIQGVLFAEGIKTLDNLKDDSR